MSAADYRESLRAYFPNVFVKGRRVESVADEPLLAPGINPSVKKALVERLLDGGVLSGEGLASDAKQPGQCCDTGCTAPEAPVVPLRRAHL